VILRKLEFKIPPIVVVVVCVATMYLLSAIDGIHVDFYSLNFVMFITFSAIGMTIIVAGVLSFKRVSTTVNPTAPFKASTLVTSEIYGYTRNPMYLGMAMVMLAWVCLLSSWWNLIIVMLFIGFINQFQIKPEERILSAKFGQQYSNYCQRVRRWI
jgi:protein-S-isoprenylcysteine O-methyltransferase Ste14